MNRQACGSGFKEKNRTVLSLLDVFWHIFKKQKSKKGCTVYTIKTLLKIKILLSLKTRERGGYYKKFQQF